MGSVRKALATWLCAAPMLTVLSAPALAAPAITERTFLRDALLSQARPAGDAVLRLPLPAPSRAAAAKAGALARDRGPGRLLVGVRSHGDLTAVAGAIEATGASTAPLHSIGVLAVRAPSIARVATLRHDPRVAYVERDRKLDSADAFDSVDPATGIPFTWAYDEVRASEALAAAGGGSRRQVAVIDTGADTGHPDLAGRLGRSYDTLSGGSDVTDFNGHGTFISGLIAAIDGNGIGGRGVAGATTVMPVRASTDGSFMLGSLLQGLDFALRRGADIVSLSLAGGGFSETQARALDVVFLNDVLPVAASGNRAEEGNPLEFPAAAIGGYRGRAGIGLSVGATRPDGRPASFSNHNDFVSVAAPGAAQGGCASGVFSTLPHDNFATAWDEPGSCSRTFAGGGGRWGYAEGTSFSAPIAAGIAALVWQVERDLASEQVADVVMRTARQTLPGGRWNEYTGTGIVDGRAAASLARVYDTTDPPNRSRARRRGNRVRVTVRRVRDRAEAGDQLAGGVSYALLVSTDGGRSFRFAVMPRRRPFRASVRLRGRRRHLIVASVCDRNGNCSSKRLGSFRARR